MNIKAKDLPSPFTIIQIIIFGSLVLMGLFKAVTAIWVNWNEIVINIEILLQNGTGQKLVYGITFLAFIGGNYFLRKQEIVARYIYALLSTYILVGLICFLYFDLKSFLIGGVLSILLHLAFIWAWKYKTINKEVELGAILYSLFLIPGGVVLGPYFIFPMLFISIIYTHITLPEANIVWQKNKKTGMNIAHAIFIWVFAFIVGLAIDIKYVTSELHNPELTVMFIVMFLIFVIINMLISIKCDVPKSN